MPMMIGISKNKIGTLVLFFLSKCRDINDFMFLKNECRLIYHSICSRLFNKTNTIYSVCSVMRRMLYGYDVEARRTDAR